MMALSVYDVAMLPDEQEKAIASLQAAWRAAHAAGDEVKKAQAHAAAEAIRASYGYSGGDAGDSFIKVVKTVQSTIQQATDAVSKSVAPVVQSIASAPAAKSVAAATETLSPTTDKSSNAQAPIIIQNGSTLPESTGEYIPTELKRPILYGGIFLLAMMALKVLMGGNK